LLTPRRNHRPCGCPHAHPFELAEVIRNKHLNPRKACADWYKGKRVCQHCGYLVNLKGHENRSGAAPTPRTPLAEIPNEEEEVGPMVDEENEAPSAVLPPDDEGNQEKFGTDIRIRLEMIGTPKGMKRILA